MNRPATSLQNSTEPRETGESAALERRASIITLARLLPFTSRMNAASVIGGLLLVHLTAPAAMPLMMNRSRTTPITMSGRIAASDSAAMDHQAIP